MIPPKELNVIDRHGGFTIESKPPSWFKGKMFDFEARERRIGPSSLGKLPFGDSLWRPGRILRGSTMGRLVAYDEEAFYQTNNDVTIAVYRVSGYGYPVLVWFDNKTSQRIA